MVSGGDKLWSCSIKFIQCRIEIIDTTSENKVQVLVSVEGDVLLSSAVFIFMKFCFTFFKL